MIFDKVGKISYFSNRISFIYRVISSIGYQVLKLYDERLITRSIYPDLHWFHRNGFSSILIFMRSTKNSPEFWQPTWLHQQAERKNTYNPFRSGSITVSLCTKICMLSALEGPKVWKPVYEKLGNKKSWFGISPQKHIRILTGTLGNWVIRVLLW